MHSLIIIILDESGSMDSKKADVIGGFNSFIREQKSVTDDEANVTFLKFNSNVNVVIKCSPVASVPELNDSTFTPRGNTALYDAIASGVEIGEKEQKEWLFDRVLCLIMTDGEENASRRTSLAQVRELITRKEQEGNWTFLYIGENPERWAQDTGYSAQNVAAYDHQQQAENFAKSTVAVKQYRKEGALQQKSMFKKS